MMLLYLCGNTRLYVSLAVDICACYLFIPKRSHKFPLKRLAHYLKKKRGCGLILNSNYDLCKVDEYSDDVFSGIYGHEKPIDPACVQIHNKFIVTFSDCPILWV